MQGAQKRKPIIDKKKTETAALPPPLICRTSVFYLPAEYLQELPPPPRASGAAPFLEQAFDRLRQLGGWFKRRSFKGGRRGSWGPATMALGVSTSQ